MTVNDYVLTVISESLSRFVADNYDCIPSSGLMKMGTGLSHYFLEHHHYHFFYDNAADSDQPQCTRSSGQRHEELRGNVGTPPSLSLSLSLS